MLTIAFVLSPLNIYLSKQDILRQSSSFHFADTRPGCPATLFQALENTSCRNPFGRPFVASGAHIKLCIPSFFLAVSAGAGGRMRSLVIKSVGKRHFIISRARLLPPERLLPCFFKFINAGGNNLVSVQPQYFQTW